MIQLQALQHVIDLFNIALLGAGHACGRLLVNQTCERMCLAPSMCGLIVCCCYLGMQSPRREDTLQLQASTSTLGRTLTKANTTCSPLCPRGNIARLKSKENQGPDNGHSSSVSCIMMQACRCKALDEQSQSWRLQTTLMCSAAAQVPTHLHSALCTQPSQL